jgi:phosphatidylglycerophosphatase A
VLGIGSLGPLGYAPASGTVSVAVAGIPAFWLLSQAPPWVYVVVAVVWTVVSVFVHDVGDRILGTEDSGKLVWDELAGYFIATLFLPFTWQIAAASFLIERAIDILKVPPARWIENRVAGGLGVVGDDVIAGLYTLVIMQLALRYAPAAWLGL